MKSRNHRIRERRMRLDLTQAYVGMLADLPVSSSQVAVSNAERGRGPLHIVQKIRAALVWLESEPRRQREMTRKVEACVHAVIQPAPIPGPMPGTSVLCLGEEMPVMLAPAPGAAASLARHLADLLHDGETEAFDALVARIPDEIGRRGGELYLDECCPAPGGLLP